MPIQIFRVQMNGTNWLQNLNLIKQTWYHVLVHGQGNETYVAESNLTTDDNIDPVDHPFVDIFFYEYDNSGQYSLKQTFN